MIGGKAQPIFVIDLARLALGTEVVITGYVLHKLSRQGYVELLIRDITGVTRAHVDKDPVTGAASYDPKAFWKNTRIRVYGRTGQTDGGTPVIRDVQQVDIISPQKPQISEFDNELREQASRMLLSRIIRDATEFFLREQFIQFESKFISTTWVDEGLEPLKVIYPGFGSPATLATSPSAQVLDFLTTTLAERAFTVSTSFSSTYRFPRAGAELEVIVAKALDLTTDMLINLIQSLAESIASHFRAAGASAAQPIPIIERTWSDGEELGSITCEGDFALLKYKASIPVKWEHWTTTIVDVIHLLDTDGNVVAEGSREVLNDTISISSITLYPSQFLSFLTRRAPARQLRDLGTFNVWT